MIEDILEDIEKERMRQCFLWSEQRHPDQSHDRGMPPLEHGPQYYQDLNSIYAAKGLISWEDILIEEIAEAFEITGRPEYIGELRTELIQCAAVIVSWLADIDSRSYDA